MNTDFDVVVVGGGIVGLASAYKISQMGPGIRVCVLDKEQTLAAHQTGHNSGVIHSGLYYKPGSAKAKNCMKGRQALIRFATEHDIPFKICGKVIVATEERELPHLERIQGNGTANGVEGIERIDQEGIRRLEPACRGIAGLRVPGTGIIDFVRVARTLGDLILRTHGANEIRLGHKVTGFRKDGAHTVVLTDRGEVRARLVVNCAGLQCDRVARLDGVDPGLRIVPFRGDYYDLTPEAASKVRGLIYPVPDPRFPFLGIHYTRKIDGSVDCGPNAVFSLKREGYSKVAFSLGDTWTSLTFPGTLRLFFNNWRYGLNEYVRAFSKRLFLKELRRFIPEMTTADIRPGKAGVRAQAVSRKGEPVDDFQVVERPHAIHVLNAPSPAATACLAIGDYICSLAREHLKDGAARYAGMGSGQVPQGVATDR